MQYELSGGMDSEMTADSGENSRIFKRSFVLSLGEFYLSAPVSAEPE